VSILALVGLLAVSPLQEPSEALQRSLRLDSSATRYRAAEQLSVSGAEGEAWLLKEIGKGSPERQRALLLACALIGSERTLAKVEEAARRGSRRRADPQRAYALLLYGATHPEAGKVPELDWKRCQTDYERACLLAGLLARPQALRAGEWDELLADDGEAELGALLAAGRMLAGETLPMSEDADMRLAAAHLLTSVLPGAAGLPTETVQAWVGRLPELWVAAARRAPSRSAAEARRLPAAASGMAAGLLLYEVAAEDRQEVFQHFDARLIDADARAWLWGTAGDLGLEFPAPETGERLDPAEVAGMLRLALRHGGRASQAARDRLPAARLRLDEGGLAQDLWPAALVIALALADSEERDPDDLARLRDRVVDEDAAARVRLLPAWNLARGALSDPSVRAHWLSTWSRGLGAGPAGYLDREGPRWVAFLLVGDTQAAEERLPLRQAPEGLALEARDYSRDHNLYRDVADYLAWGYRFGLPD
jgi:hypothetical protein